jgi:hypothetical protein
MPDCFAYFPIAKEITKLPKQWIVNVAFTVLGDPFRTWIKKGISDRNIKVAIQKDLNIGMDPELLIAYRASNAVSRKSQPLYSCTCRTLPTYSFFLLQSVRAVVPTC